MKICRFKHLGGQIRIGLLLDEVNLLDLRRPESDDSQPLLESDDLPSQFAVAAIAEDSLIRYPALRARGAAGGLGSRGYLSSQQEGPHGGIRFQRHGLRPCIQALNDPNSFSNHWRKSGAPGRGRGHSQRCALECARTGIGSGH